MSDRDAFREAQKERRSFGKAKQHEKRLEAATYTAAEVKVLTETASRVAYALGRKDALTEIADEMAVDHVTSGRGYAVVQISRETYDEIMASRDPQATSDATSGVPEHQEMSEAVRSPQEPCGHPTCPCASQEA